MNSTSVSIDVANQKESAKTSLIRNPYFFNDEAENTDCPISPKLKPNKLITMIFKNMTRLFVNPATEIRNAIFQTKTNLLKKVLI